MRPIVETDCGLWPTPTLPNGGRSIAHADEWRKNTPYCRGKKIQVDLSQVAKGMWPTPTSRDHKDGAFTPNVEINGLLGRTVWNGLSEPTAKPGALAPEFVCWLMGFPAEWEDCAPTAMPSSRKSRQKS